MDHKTSVEAIEIRLLLEAIHAAYGYDLRGYAPTSMRRRVLNVLAKSGLDHLGELQHKVLTDPEFFSTFKNDLTVSVSNMFRDPSFYSAFRTRIVPRLRTYPLLRLWHSGCATGEEVYSMAILLYEEGLYERSQIYATDVSMHALEQAKEGVYRTEHLESFTENYKQAGGTRKLSDYYNSAYDRIEIKEFLRRNILFFQHDLVTDHVFGEMQVIFCRNVLIYFGPSLRAQVLRKFSQSLCVGGFLCLGNSEQLRTSDPKHKFLEAIPEERIYQLETRENGRE